MINKKQYIKYTIIVLLAVSMSLVAFSGVSVAQNNPVNVTEDENPSVKYGTGVDFYGEQITENSSSNYLVELVEYNRYNEMDDGSLIDDATLAGGVIPGSALTRGNINVNNQMQPAIALNTNIYDRYVSQGAAGPKIDPTGDYIVRPPITGSNITVNDQHPTKPSGVDVAIRNLDINGDMVNLDAESSSSQATSSDYSWTASFGPKDGVTEGSYTILDSSQYANINYHGLDGIYDVGASDSGSESLDYYPGSLVLTDASPSITEYPYKGQIELNMPYGEHIQESEVLGVKYTDVNDRSSLRSKEVSGSLSSGTRISTKDYVHIDSSYPDTQSIENTSYDIILESNKNIEATYEAVVQSDTESLTAGNNNSSPSIDVEYTVEGPQGTQLRLQQSNIVLDSLSFNYQSGNIDKSDIEIVESNIGNGTLIDLPQSVAGDLAGSDNELTVTYQRASNTTTVEDEVLLPYGTEATSGSTLVASNNEDLILEVSDRSVLHDNVNVTLNDDTLGTPDQIDLFDEGGIDFKYDARFGTEENVSEFILNRDINQSVTQFLSEFRNPDNEIRNLQTKVDAGFTLNFDVTENQVLKVQYRNYEAVIQDRSEQIVGSNELGPSGNYKLDDPRLSVDGDKMNLATVTGDNVTAQVANGDDFHFDITNTSFDPSSVSNMNIELSQYNYNITEEIVDNFSSEGKSLNYTVRHDYTQVDHRFTVNVQTGVGVRSDTVSIENGSVPAEFDDINDSVSTVLVNSTSIDTGIPYKIEIYDSTGEVLSKDVVIEDGKDTQNLEIPLKDSVNLENYEDEELTVVMKRPDNFASVNDGNVDYIPLRNERVSPSTGDVNVGTIVSDTFEINSTDSASVMGDLNQMDNSSEDPVKIDWTLSNNFEGGDMNDEGQLVYTNRLNSDTEPKGPIAVPVGSELVVSGSEFDVGDKFVLRPENEEERDVMWNVELDVESSDTTDENQVVINTSIPSIENKGSLEGRFELVDKEGVLDTPVFNYTTTEQIVSSEVNPEFVNLNGEAEAKLNISSQLRDYDIKISSEQFDAEELLDEPGIFTDDAIDKYDIEIVNKSNDSIQSVILHNLSERPEVVNLSLNNVEAGEYGLNVDVVGSIAKTQTSFESRFGPEGDAQFVNPVNGNEQDTYTTAEGDRVRIGVQLQETRTFEFGIVNESYKLDDIKIRANDGVSSVNVVMDTYRADSISADGTPLNFSDVFTVRGGEVINDTELPPITSPLETGLYTLEIYVDDNEADLSTINIVDRETTDVNTWVLPKEQKMTLENLRNNGTLQGEVAKGDTLVVEMDMTGFDTPEVITNNTSVSKLINPYRRAELAGPSVSPQDVVDTMMPRVDSLENASQINLEITGEKPPNRPRPHILMENAEKIETTVGPSEDNTAFVFIPLTSQSFSNFNSNYNLDSIGPAYNDELRDYDVHLNFTESYKYYDNDTTEDYTTQMGVNKRIVRPDMQSVRVNESELETRFGILQEPDATVSGTTHVAPGTKLDIVVRDDISFGPIESPVSMDKSVVVQEGDNDVNTVSANFDVSSLEIDRRMTIQFFGINNFKNPAIIKEAPQEPVIEELDITGSTTVGSTVSFNSTVSGPSKDSLVYSWNFGDGRTTEVQGISTITNVYNGAGEFTVTLTVEDPSSGLNDTITRDVNINEEQRTAPEIMNVIYPRGNVSVGESVSFGVITQDNEVDSPSALQYNWEFGDQTTSSEVDPVHTYPIAGEYSVTVTVADPINPNLQNRETFTINVVDDTDDDTDNNDTNDTEWYNLTVTAEDAETNETINNLTLRINSTLLDQPINTTLNNSSTPYVAEDLEAGEYTVFGSAEGYNETNATIQLSNDTEVVLEMNSTPTNNTSNNSGGGGGGIGLTLILGVVALIGAGAYIGYRRFLSN